MKNDWTRLRHLILGFLLLAALAACANPTPAAPGPTAAVTAFPDLAPPPTAIIAPTRASDPTATSDARLPPEDWQKWPVVPVATGGAIDIYRQGQAMGNDPHAFSKAGDCQSVRAAFMGFFDLPDRYNLGQDYQYLQETIDNFAGYFNTDGQAVKGGFNAATVLSPLWADPVACQPGENPLECELRITRPSVVFVSFEVWWEERTTETYEKYMRQVIETVIAHGAVPILATKADNVEGDHAINLATARLAREYDLPMWNFWRAVQPLPYRGLDPVRNDGFHISTDAWNVRSFTGLQALDSIWKGLRDAGAPLTAQPSTSAGPTSSPSPAPTRTPGPGPMGGTERLAFGLMARTSSGYEARGVYLVDLSAGTAVQLFGSGFALQDASPDGSNLLVSQGSSLFRSDGTRLIPLDGVFFSLGGRGALWLSYDQIAVIMIPGNATNLYVMESDGTEPTFLAGLPTPPIEIYPSSDGTHITWESGTCSGLAACTPTGAWLTDIASGQSQALGGMARPLVSPDGQTMAFVESAAADQSSLALASLSGGLPRSFPLPGDLLADFAWAPGGEWLAVNMAERSDYSGRVTGSLTFVVNSRTFSNRQIPSTTLLNPRLVWSPDGAALAWFGTDRQDSSYRVHLYVADLASTKVTDLTDLVGLSANEYLFVSNAVWLAGP
jgi:hypothetical protein